MWIKKETGKLSIINCGLSLPPEKQNTMEKRKITLRAGIVTLFILFAALSRLIPHPANFAPISAMALFGAAYYDKKYLAFVIPIVAMFLCDLFLNNVIYSSMFDGFVLFYPGSLFTYLSFIAIAFIGFGLLKKVGIKNLIISSLLASVTFFLISNFGSWASGLMPYSKDLAGLILCYAEGLPFLKTGLLGDLFYCGAMFGLFELAQSRIPALRRSTV